MNIFISLLFFIQFLQLTQSNQTVEINQLHLNKGKQLYPITIKENENIEIYLPYKLTEEIKVIYKTNELMIISPEEIDVEYSIFQESQHSNCPHCPFNCEMKTYKCFNGLKNSVFTFDSFLDLILPNRSLLVFIVFLCLVIITLIMSCTMCCRFVDCLTDMFCDSKKKREKEKEEKHKDTFKEMVAKADMQNEMI